jgi:bla regulator protein BlaR1
MIWTAIANHLWQSTLFLLAAAALTLLLRKNQARIRYAVWLAASLKFLLPFSLLIALGGHLAKPHHVASTPVYSTIQQVTQPFSKTAHPASLVEARVPIVPRWEQTVMLLWLFGAAAVFTRWCQEWRQISTTLAEAQPLHQGDEVRALREAEQRAGIQKPVPLLLSRSSLEPGIFGIRHPVLLWPAEISGRLQAEHVEAIVAHEVCHLRRRDNLTAAFHMIVEAIFWFHPLVWWLGVRLVAERERACDEHVLALGNQPATYAESILKTCEFCVESPLACVSGVSGADLKSRILRIMTAPRANQLTLTRKLLLVCAVVLAIALPAGLGLFYAPPTQAAIDTPTKVPDYEVVSIKINKSGAQMARMMYTAVGFNATNIPLKGLIQDAYGIEEHRLLGAPGWLSSEPYDVEAKVDNADIPALPNLTISQRQLMLQPVLRDRLQLRVHWETKQLIVYALVVDKSGLKMHEAKPGDTYPDGMKGPDGNAGGAGIMMVGGGQLTSQAIDLSALVRMLSDQVGATVLDKTGLTGKYDVKLHWQPEQRSTPPSADAAEQPTPAPTDSSGPSLFSALQDQLGLKLESQKSPVQVLVIDHVERPSPN